MDAKMTFSELNKIYMKLGDDLSKKIFEYRVLYSISRDQNYVEKLMKTHIYVKEIWDQLENIKGDIVIYGAGEMGKGLIEQMPHIRWKCIIDTNPKMDKFHEIPIIFVDEFLKKYEGEWIVISSRIWRKEMEEKLIRGGIPEAKIINIGERAAQLWKDQYFDLEYLPKNREGIFADIGGLDGESSINYYNWCGKNEVVVFEPNRESIEICKQNLDKYGINYEIVPMGAWSEETSLNFEPQKRAEVSHISQDGTQVINVTTLDKQLGNRKISFIKMDIEGSEYEALVGAEKIISEQMPILAISIYHKLEDIFSLPKLILEFSPHYKLYLRHYNFWGPAETVLYAIPEI